MLWGLSYPPFMRNPNPSSDQIEGPESLGRPRLALRRRASLGAVLVVVLSSAACGGGSHGPGVARASTTATTHGGSPGSAQATGPVAYAACVRTHGFPNFPDPETGGIFDKSQVRAATAGMGVSEF